VATARQHVDIVDRPGRRLDNRRLEDAGVADDRAPDAGALAPGIVDLLGLQSPGLVRDAGEGDQGGQRHRGRIDAHARRGVGHEGRDGGRQMLGAQFGRAGHLGIG
jgi:hypothetical protein